MPQDCWSQSARLLFCLQHVPTVSVFTERQEQRNNSRKRLGMWESRGPVLIVERSSAGSGVVAGVYPAGACFEGGRGRGGEEAFGGGGGDDAAPGDS